MSMQMLGTACEGMDNNKIKIFLNPRKANLGNVTKSICDFVKDNSYPGDLNLNSYDWITEAALRMDATYNPNFMFLSYANPYYAAIHTPPNVLMWEKHLEKLYYEVERFINQTDYIPIIVGTGGTYVLEDRVDLSYLEGRVNFNWPGSVYASVYNSTAKDLKMMKKDNAIQMVIPRDRLRVMAEEPQEKLPDYFLIARRGFALTDADINNIHRVNARDAVIPVSAPRPVNSISKINKLVRNLLAQQKRVVLIILEGISCSDFKWDYQPCSNTYSWFTYLPEGFQYLTLGTGLELLKFNVFSKFCSNNINFNNYLKNLALEGKIIGSKNKIKSAAIGSRKTLTHIASGADITVECGY